jgi:hypothetical protein
VNDAKFCRYIAIYYTPDLTEMGPDLEEHEQLHAPDEEITAAEAHRRAESLAPRHPDAWGHEVYERKNIHYDFGWEWDLELVEKP